MTDKAEIPLPANVNELFFWMGSEAQEVFWEKIFDIDADYKLPLTNNEPRITKDGVELFHIADFGSDVLAIFAKILNVRAGLEKSDYFDD